MGEGTGYANSLLIEDRETQPALSRSLGGYASQYQNDMLFLDWLDSIHWSDKK